MTRRRGLRTTCIGAVLFMAVACFSKQVPQAMLSSADQNPAQDKAGASKNENSGNQPGFQLRTPRYLLRPDDVLDLSFEFSPEFNQTVSVQPDGYVSLRGIGEMHVAGKTIPELNEALLIAYEKILHDPVIVATLKEFEKPYFIAGGQVSHPGKYELRGDTTVTEAVAMAGGFSQIARHSQVLLFRRVSDGWTETQILNVKKMLGEKNLREDLHIKPGDMIFVPQNRISKIERFLPTPRALLYFNPTQF